MRDFMNSSKIHVSTNKEYKVREALNAPNFKNKIDTTLNNQNDFVNLHFDNGRLSIDKVIKHMETNSVIPAKNYNQMYDFILHPDKGSSLSDQNSININGVSNLTTRLQEKFANSSDYETVRLALEGRTIGEIVDENGDLKPLSMEDVSRRSIISAERLNQINELIKGFNLIENVNDEIKNIRIKEILVYDSGFDAVVLEKSDGTIMVCAAPTTSVKDKKDIGAISSSLFKYLMGNKTFECTLPLIKKWLPWDLGTCQETYNQQIEDCKELITTAVKIAEEKDVQVEFFGYSHGGGVLATSYALCQDSLSILHVRSVTLYNPFLLHTEMYSDKSQNVDGSDLINSLKSDVKLTIYSTEGDIVSSLNNSMDDFKDRVIYVPADDIEQTIDPITYGDLIKMFTKGNGLDDVFQEAGNRANILYKIIIGSMGTHGIAASDNAFDNNGNLIQEGEPTNINKLFAEITNKEYKVKNDSLTPDLNFLVKQILTEIFSINGMTLNIGVSYVLDVDINKDGKNDINGIDVAPLLEYLINNAGEYDVSEIVDGPFREMMLDYFENNPIVFDYLIDELAYSKVEDFLRPYVEGLYKSPYDDYLVFYYIFCGLETTEKWIDEYYQTMTVPHAQKVCNNLKNDKEKVINAICDSLAKSGDDEIYDIIGLILNNDPNWTKKLMNSSRINAIIDEFGYIDLLF